MTTDQQQYICENYDVMSYSDIASKIGYSEAMVGYVARQHGLHKQKLGRLNLTKDQMEFIKQNYLVMTSTQIGKSIGLTDKQVRGWIKNHISDREPKLRQFNNRYFQNIDTPTRAYWLGFIYADGWITSNQHEFGIELQIGDKYILEQLNDELGGVHKIKCLDHNKLIVSNAKPTISQSCVLRVYSKPIVLDLHNNGIDYRKSSNGSTMFPVVREDLFPAFLRGCIDGDGCIHEMKDGILAVHITGANKAFMEYIRNETERLYCIKSSVYSEDIDGYQKKYRWYCYRKSDVKKLLDIIYADSGRDKLIRKYNTYTNFYGLTV